MKTCVYEYSQISRMSPTKVMTIPGLELSVCLLLAKLTHKGLDTLKQPVDSA